MKNNLFLVLTIKLYKRLKNKVAYMAPFFTSIAILILHLTMEISLAKVFIENIVDISVALLDRGAIVDKNGWGNRTSLLCSRGRTPSSGKWSNRLGLVKSKRAKFFDDWPLIMGRYMKSIMKLRRLLWSTYPSFIYTITQIKY